MRKLIIEKDSPSGEVLIMIPEFEIMTWLPYITDSTFHKEGLYEEKIKTIENRTYLISAVKLNKTNYFQKLKFKSDWLSLWASLVLQK